MNSTLASIVVTGLLWIIVALLGGVFFLLFPAADIVTGLAIFGVYVLLKDMVSLTVHVWKS